MEQDILEQLYFGRIVPWENRNDKTPEIEQCSEQVYQDMEDVYKRQHLRLAQSAGNRKASGTVLRHRG